MFRFLRLVMIFICMTGSAALAVETKLPDEQEARARNLFTELRCVVCQNQSIDSSDADVARDLRQIVREQIAAGKSDSGIRDYLVARYGTFILLKPEFTLGTALLWGTPLIVLVLGGVLIFRRFRYQPNAGATDATGELTSQEAAKLAAIVGRDADN